MSFLDRLSLWNARFLQKPMMSVVRNGPILRVLFALSIRATNPLPRRVAVTKETLGRVPARRIWTGAQSDAVLLYLHGGGFVIGDGFTYLPMAARIAQASGMTVWLPDYRLAPEHPFPAAPEDALACYRALLQVHPAEKIVVGGDSAGGCLTLALLHQCAAEGLAMPGALVLLSPATDLRLEAQEAVLNGPEDILLSKRWGKWAIDGYMGSGDRSDPRASPVAAPFANAPPVLVQYAAGEALAPQIRAGIDALRNAGAPVTVEVFEGTYHAFQIAGLQLAFRAIDQIGAFLRARFP